MDFNFNVRPARRGGFASVMGTLADLQPMRLGNRRADGCMLLATVEDTEGNITNFVISPTTFVVDFEPFTVGEEVVFFYRTDAPAPLIYPPQFSAAVAAKNLQDRMIDVSFYNASLTNAEQTLRLNLDRSVEVRTTNNQFFQGSPANRNLVVLYSISTRSIPAQTTPERVIVLCE